MYYIKIANIPHKQALPLNPSLKPAGQTHLLSAQMLPSAAVQSSSCRQGSPRIPNTLIVEASVDEVTEKVPLSKEISRVDLYSEDGASESYSSLIDK